MRKIGLVLIILIGGIGCLRASVVDDLRRWLTQPVEQRGNITGQKFAAKSISKEEAEDALKLIDQDWREHSRAHYEQVWKDKQIVQGERTMRFKYKVCGEKPADGRSLYISMHGGGGTTAEINDQQWENQIHLYTPKEGVYVAPRSLENVWNMWFLPYLDGLYEELIQAAVVIMGVNPNKVYITGYSAGGDGTYRMAPRMADYWAAALMCAGHPGSTSAVGLRNLPFGMWVGFFDSAYQRNQHALKWWGMLRALQESDPDGYVHNVKLPQTGHWMNQEDTAAFHWMAQFKRNPYPEKVVWKQDSIYFNSSMYWLSLPKDKVKADGLIVAEHHGNDFYISRCYADELIIGLNDEMIDYDKPVVVRYQGKEVFRGRIKRTLATLYRSFEKRKDASFCFSAEIRVKL